MRRPPAVSLVVALAVALALPGQAAGDADLAAREAWRRALLSHRLPLRPPSDGGRRKPDAPSVIDLLSVTCELTVPAGGFPEAVRHHLSLRLLEPTDILSLAALTFEPVAIRYEDGAPLEFDYDRRSGELVVFLESIHPPGERLAIVIDARLTLPCDDPSGCIDHGPLRHLVEFGWYPLSFEAGLLDRFQVDLRLLTQADDVVSATGARFPAEDTPEGRLYRYVTERNTVLPAFTVGPYFVRERDGPAPIQAFIPPGADDEGQAISAEADATLRLYQQILGPYPFVRLAITGVDDATGAGLGTQANILLPTVLWQIHPGDEQWGTVAEVVSHEIGHMYFFNAIGVVDAAEPWLSEGFAEFVATRRSEARTGTRDHALTNYWAYVLAVGPRGDMPIFSDEISGHPHYFELVYQKGGYVMEMLRQRLGTELFDAVMQRYVEAFTDQIATTPELVDFWSEASGADLHPFFDQWVYSAGFPTLHVSAEPARGDNDLVSLSFEQEENPHGPFRGPLPVRIHTESTAADFAVELGGGDVRLAAGPALWVEIDPDLTLFRRVRPSPSADVNLSGVVDGMDLLDVAYAQGRSTPDPAWRDAVDVDDSQTIDGRDLRQVIDQFGSGW